MRSLSAFQSRKLLCIFITLITLVLVILIGILSTGSNSISYYNWINIYGVIGWIMLIWSILSWKIIRNEIFSIYTMFLMVFYTFTFGQGLLFVFNLNSEQYSLLNRGFTEIQFMEAQLFTLLSLGFFHMGALIISQRSYNKVGKINLLTTEEDDKNQLKLKALSGIGIILLIISLPAFIYDTIQTVSIVASSGYRALYGYDEATAIQNRGLFTRIFAFTSSYFLPALICLLISYRKNITRRRIILFLMMATVVNNLYVGDRGSAVTLMISLLCIYHYAIKPINGKSALFIAILGYMLTSFLAIVANLRSQTNRQLSDYFINFKDSLGNENLFVTVISEMGAAMRPLILIQDLFPSTSEFFYGKSYIYAVSAIFPNLGFWDLHPARIYSNGSTWLMEKLDLWSGPGFSLIADAFRNFGWYGFIVLLGFGFMFGRIFSSVDKSTIYFKPEVLCIVMIFFNATLMSVRGDNLNIIRPLFYVVIPIYLLIKIYYSNLVIRKQNRTARI